MVDMEEILRPLNKYNGFTLPQFSMVIKASYTPMICPKIPIHRLIIPRNLIFLMLCKALSGFLNFDFNMRIALRITSIKLATNNAVKGIVIVVPPRIKKSIISKYFDELIYRS